MRVSSEAPIRLRSFPAISPHCTAEMADSARQPAHSPRISSTRSAPAPSSTYRSAAEESRTYVVMDAVLPALFSQLPFALAASILEQFVAQRRPTRSDTAHFLDHRELGRQRLRSQDQLSPSRRTATRVPGSIPSSSRNRCRNHQLTLAAHGDINLLHDLHLPQVRPISKVRQ